MNTDIDWSKVISTFAIMISIITIVITRRNLKRQLRLNKLEEILEILHYLNGYYDSIHNTFSIYEQGINDYKLGNINSIILSEAKKYRTHLIEIVKMEIILSKISRLKILSNAYLKNSKKIDDLKIRIHTISDIYYFMYLFIFSEGHTIKKDNDAIIPKADEMQRFINRIENDIIIQMNLGYENINHKSQINYFKNQFKKDLGLRS